MGRKRPKNLLLDAEALNWAEAYCEQHGTTLSRLVEDFLMALPSLWSSPEAEPKSPIVRRLRGAVHSGAFEPDAYLAYHDYLYRTYQRGTRDES